MSAFTAALGPEAAPPGPVRVADTDVVFRPIKAVIPTDACLAYTGIANTCGGVNKTESVGGFHAGPNPTTALKA